MVSRRLSRRRTFRTGSKAQRFAEKPNFFIQALRHAHLFRDSLSWTPLFTHFLKMLFHPYRPRFCSTSPPQCNEKCLQHLLIQPIQFFTEKWHQPAHVPLEAEFPSSRSGQIHFSASQSHAHGFIHALPQHAYNRHSTLSPEESQNICNFLSYAQAPFPARSRSAKYRSRPPRRAIQQRSARREKQSYSRSNRHTRLYRHHHHFTASYAFPQAAAESRPAQRY